MTARLIFLSDLHGAWAVCLIQKMTTCKKDLYKIYKVYTEHLDISKQSFEGFMY